MSLVQVSLVSLAKDYKHLLLLIFYPGVGAARVRERLLASTRGTG